jgi:hypothetical protein
MTIRNYDGGVWRLAWDKTPEEKFRGWVVGHPRVVAICDDWSAMEAALIELISETLQAGEWTADWDPPPPSPDPERVLIDQEFITIVGEGRYWMFTDPALLFGRGICPRCGTGLGSRTELELSAYVEIPAGVMFCGFNCGGPCGIDLYRAETVELLGEERLCGALIRPIHRLGRGRVKYVELVASEGPTYVGIAGEPMEGWRCPDCGSTHFSHRYEQAAYRTLIRASDVPRGVPAFWFRHPHPTLCVQSRWWRTVRHEPAFRGVISRPLWVLPDQFADPQPPLRNHADRSGDERIGYLKRQEFLRQRLRDL